MNFVKLYILIWLIKNFLMYEKRKMLYIFSFLIIVSFSFNSHTPFLIAISFFSSFFLTLIIYFLKYYFLQSFLNFSLD